MGKIARRRHTREFKISVIREHENETPYTDELIKRAIAQGLKLIEKGLNRQYRYGRCLIATSMTRSKI